MKRYLRAALASHCMGRGQKAKAVVSCGTVVQVYPEGDVCLSILNDDHDMGGGWCPSISVKQVYGVK